MSDRVIMGKTAQSRKVTKGSSGPNVLPTPAAIAKAVHELQTSQSETLSLQLTNDSITINDAR